MIKTISLFRFLFILAAFFTSQVSYAQNIQNNQNSQGIIRDEIIFLEGTTIPAQAQSASKPKALVNAPLPFAIFNSSLNGVTNRINAVKPNQKETKLAGNSIEWFRLPNKFNDTQEGYIIRIAEKKTGNTLCQFALGKANDRAKIYKSSDITVDFDEPHKIATLKIGGKPLCQIKLEKPKFLIQPAFSTQEAFDIFLKSGDNL